MADFIFNIAKGAFAEKFRDAAANGIWLALEVAEADDTLNNHDDLAALLAGGNTEWTASGYARDTGLTGSITVDDTNNRVDVDTSDFALTSVTGNASTDVIFAYEEAAADATRIPLSNHDAAVTPNGGDITIQVNASGFGRAG